MPYEANAFCCLLLRLGLAKNSKQMASLSQFLQPVKLRNFQWVGGDAAWPLAASWPHTWLADNRTPLFTFDIIGTGLPVAPTPATTTYAFYAFSAVFWAELLSAVFLECLLAIPTALVLYYLVVAPHAPHHHHHQGNRNGHNSNKRPRPGTTTAAEYLIGWGLLLPMWIGLPAPAIHALGVSNLVFRFALCAITPTVSMFRILATLYGFAPHYATQSVASYLLYFCSPMPLLRRRRRSGNPVAAAAATAAAGAATAETTVPAPASRGLRRLVKAFGLLMLTGAYQSVLVASPHFPMYALGPASTPAGYYHWTSLLNVALWLESLQWAVLLHLYLLTFAEGLMGATCLLTGRETIQFDNHPLTASTSPADFWGRRWNLLIHECLKDGVYKPVLSFGGAQWLATFAAFTASGLFHEWLLPAVFYNYPNTHGVALAFFWWQAALVMLEVAGGPWCRGATRLVPRPVRTALVIVVGLPVAHWFTDSYVRSDFFAHGQVGMPMILALLKD